MTQTHEHHDQSAVRRGSQSVPARSDRRPRTPVKIPAKPGIRSRRSEPRCRGEATSTHDRDRRPRLRPADRDAVRHVCCATGYMGTPIDPQSAARRGTYRERLQRLLHGLVKHESLLRRGARETTWSVTYSVAVTLARAVMWRSRSARECAPAAIAFRPATAGFVWRAFADSVAGSVRRDLPPARSATLAGPHISTSISCLKGAVESESALHSCAAAIEMLVVHGTIPGL